LFGNGRFGGTGGKVNSKQCKYKECPHNFFSKIEKAPVKTGAEFDY